MSAASSEQRICSNCGLPILPSEAGLLPSAGNAAHAAEWCIVRLRSRLAALELDRARLDFLDEANARLNAQTGSNYHWKMVMNHNVTRLMVDRLAIDLRDSEAHGLRSCRAAIDVQMRDIYQARSAAALKVKLLPKT